MKDHYTYRVTWSAEDGEHVGLCTEFPSLSWLAVTPEAALKGIRKVVAQAVEDLQQSGEEVPEPFSDRRFSGRFMVRVPPEVHRGLATRAAEEGVSLNRLVSAKLAAEGSYGGGVALSMEGLIRHLLDKLGRGVDNLVERH